MDFLNILGEDQNSQGFTIFGGALLDLDSVPSIKTMKFKNESHQSFASLDRTYYFQTKPNVRPFKKVGNVLVEGIQEDSFLLFKRMESNSKRVC